MKKSDENKNSNHSDGSFLKDIPNKNSISKSHQSYLGLSTPNDYFSMSKSEILASVSNVISRNKQTFTIKSRKVRAIAASIAILIGAATFMWYHSTTLKTNKMYVKNDKANEDHMKSESDNVLIASLFIEDSEADQYIDEYLIKEIITDLDQLEHESNNILINSLFTDDSDINKYVDEYLVEKIISDLDQLERESDNVIINSLFIDDSETDKFVEDYIIEKIIL